MLIGKNFCSLGLHMLYSLSRVDKGQLEQVTRLEKKMGREILAFSNSKA